MDGRRTGELHILFLAASHRQGDELALGREVREIEERIRASRGRDAISLTIKLAVRPSDVMQALREHEPHIVHFSGHGSRTGQILLVDDDGDPMPVGKEALARLFEVMRGRTRVVVFNACFSQAQAEAVTEHVDCAIGTSAALSDVGARVFSSELYSAIAHGTSVGDAFEQARAALSIHGLLEEDIPTLLAQNANGQAADPHGIFLLAPAPKTRAPRADTATPPLKPPAAAKLWTHAARGAVRYRMVFAILLLLLLGVLAFVAWALWSPRLLVPRFEDGGVAVAVRRHAPEPVREAHAHLLRTLQGLGEQQAQPVTLPVLGADEQALVAAARDAGASLVVTIEDQGGPRLRVLPIAGQKGTHIVDHIPPLPIARAETRAALAPVLFTLSWLAAREPGSLPHALALPIPDEAAVGRTIAVLTMYLRGLIDTHQQWVHEAQEPLSRMLTGCTDALVDWDCALATYLYYGLAYPKHPRALARLAAVAARGPGAIADAATLELMSQRCAAAPDQAPEDQAPEDQAPEDQAPDQKPDWPLHRIEDELARLRLVWPPGDCLRLGLAVPASCLVITHQRSEAWIDALAAPALEDYTHCGPMAARVLAQRAYMHAVAGAPGEAAEDYFEAAARAPADPIYMLDWAAAALQQEPLPPELPAQIDEQLARLTRPEIPYQTRVWASFLRWYATGAAARAHQLCEQYRDVPPDEAAMPALGPLGERLCLDARARACRVYHILIEPRYERADAALCNTLLAIGVIDQ